MIEIRCFFLQNEYIVKEKDSIYNSVILNKMHVRTEDSNFYLDNLNQDYLSVYRIIKNEQLARVEITYKSSNGAIINLEKRNDGTWYITNYNVWTSIQLKDTKATKLYHEISRQKLIKSER